MTPYIYYESERVKLYCGDCLDVLPTLSGVDAVVTDPPYGMDLLTSTGRLGSHTSQAGTPGRIYAPVIGDDKPFDPAPWINFPIVVLWGANWYASRLPDAKCWLTWDKRDGINPNNMADCELAWTNLDMPNRLYSHRWMGMIRDSADMRVHPTQKPESLMVWVLETARVPKDATVFDPYAGSATVAVACLRTGRKSISCEIDESYCAIAAKRIREAESQLQMDFGGGE